jgi:hypothetical protein
MVFSSRDPLVGQNVPFLGCIEVSSGLGGQILSDGVEYSPGVNPEVWKTRVPFLEDREREHITSHTSLKYSFLEVQETWLWSPHFLEATFMCPLIIIPYR